MQPDDVQNEITHRFRRRFTFGLNAVFSSLAGLVLIALGFNHPCNNILQSGELIFAGFANPYLLIGGGLLIASVLAHGAWVLYREGHLNGRRFALSIHAVAAAASAGTLLTFLNSWWFLELHHGDVCTPISHLTPPAITFILLPLIILALIPHSLWQLYQELLERELQKSAMNPKLKRLDPSLNLRDEEWASVNELADAPQNQATLRRLLKRD